MESEFDITQIHDRRANYGQLHYLVSWAPELLTEHQIHLYKEAGFELENMAPTADTDEEGHALYTIVWRPAWQKVDAIRHTPSYGKCLSEVEYSHQPARRT